MRIDELRKRLLEERNRFSGEPAKAQSDSDAPNAAITKEPDERVERHEDAQPAHTPEPVETPEPVKPSVPSASGVVEMSKMEQSSVAGAVAQSFERTKSFENRFAKLMSTFEQADKLAQEAIEALGQLSELADHLPSLVQAFEPMKAVQRQLAQLSSIFEPMKPAENQIIDFSQSFSKAFNENLTKIAQMLEPVRDFQGRLAQLADDFSPANDLQKRFEQLAHSFDEKPVPATDINAGEPSKQEKNSNETEHSAMNGAAAGS